MTTRDPLWNPNSRQPAGVEHWKTYLRDPLHGAIGDVLRSLFPDPSVLGEAWPVTYGAGKVNVDTTVTRGAVIEDADGRSRLVRPTAALGAGEWFETLAGSAGFEDVWFPNAGGVTYYVSLRYELIPVQARSLGEPSTSGALAESRFDVYQERVGRQGDPDLVTEPIAGQLQFRLDSLIGPTLWAGDPAKTRQVVIWKRVPATGGAEAVALVDGVSSGGHFIATVPHVFGQAAGSASTTAADYGACVLGPVVETVDPTGDPRHVLLATVTDGVVDTSGQNVVDIPEQTDERLDELEAWLRGYTYGPAWKSRPGIYLGTNADTGGWNDITLTVDAGEVVAAFSGSPFGVASGAFAYIDGHLVREDATDAPDWTDYRYTPAGAGTFTVCLDVVDETDTATPKWAGKLTTYVGTYANAILAGLLPLVTYTWNGAAITAQAPLRLRAARGERKLETLGGDKLYLCPDTMGSGSGSLVLEAVTADSKGAERLHLLTDNDDDTADSTIAFERRKDTLDALRGHVEKIAAQGNAAAQTVDAEFSALQLGGSGDLAVVGRTVTDGALQTRRVSVAHAANPATKEILSILEDGGSAEDVWPTGGTKKPILLTGDFGFSGSNGKRVYQRIPHRPVRGVVHDGGAGCIPGPWFFGPMGTGLNHEPANDGVHWLDYVLLNPNLGGGLIDPRTDAWIPIDVRELDKAYDVAVYLSLDETALAGQVEMMFDLIKVNFTGTVTVVGELKAGAGNRWISLETPNGAVAGWRSLGAHGKDSATGNDWWTEDIREFDVNYTWFIRVRAAVWTADPLNLLAGRGAVWFGLPYINVQRQKPFGR